MQKPYRKIETIILFIFLVVIVVVFFFIHRPEPTTSYSTTVPPGFTNLFNGNDLTGWTMRPANNAFYAKNGILVCSGKRRPPYILLTEKTFENFVLELDFNVSLHGSSGILLYTPTDGQQSKVGFELRIQDDFGQPVSRYISGALFDMAAPLTNAVYPALDWNHFKIVMNWPRLKVWLNEIQIHDLDLAADHQLRYRFRMGPIGLQNLGSTVEFRNIFIKELPGKVVYDSLFNGRDLTGWQMLGDANWQVQDQAIIATEGSGYLISEQQYQNFEFITQLRLSRRQYGGIYYRWLDETDPGYFAEFYNLRDALRYSADEKETQMLPVFTNTWLPYQIIAVDRQSEVRINGLAASQNLTHQKIRPGQIAIYFHPDADTLMLKNLLIRPLDKW